MVLRNSVPQYGWGHVYARSRAVRLPRVVTRTPICVAIPPNYAAWPLL